MLNQVYEKKMQIVNDNFQTSGWFILPFESITSTTFNNIEIVEENEGITPTIKWFAYVTYNYVYVLRSDLYQVFTTYINERQPENNLTIKIDPSTLQFLKDSNTTTSYEVKQSWKVYSISTQIDVIQTYDFQNDPKQITTDIKNKITWMSIDDAWNFILSTYNEVGSVKISVPLRYNSVPIIKSRIRFTYK